jgi:hypothetical protein
MPDNQSAQPGAPLSNAGLNTTQSTGLTGNQSTDEFVCAIDGKRHSGRLPSKTINRFGYDETVCEHCYRVFEKLKEQTAEVMPATGDAYYEGRRREVTPGDVVRDYDGPIPGNNPVEPVAPVAAPQPAKRGGTKAEADGTPRPETVPQKDDKGN